MRRVEQQVIAQGHPQFRMIDQMAFASKNLWNLANYHVRQSFIFQKTYLNNAALFHLLKETDANPRPASQSGQSSALATAPRLGGLFCSHGGLLRDPRAVSRVTGVAQQS